MKTEVMFVDDEPNVLSALRRMLFPMRENWNLRFAESGERALSMLRDRPADVVVSDMRMPGMNGTELHEALIERGRNMPVVYISGESSLAQASSSLKCSAQKTYPLPTRCCSGMRHCQPASLAVLRV